MASPGPEPADCGRLEGDGRRAPEITSRSPDVDVRVSPECGNCARELLNESAGSLPAQASAESWRAQMRRSVLVVAMMVSLGTVGGCHLYFEDDPYTYS